MTTQNPNGNITTIISNKIATIEFSHPASNSFTSKMLNSFTSELHNLSANPDVAVIVIQSSGTNVFCAGASFNELKAVSNLAEGTQFFSGFANVLNAMRTCPKLIIGNIQGKSVGGGVGIIAACDYALATQESAIKLSELAIGIGPFVIEPAISRKIGKSAAAEITLESNNWKTATWANQKGLYAKVFETKAELDSEVTQFATQLANYPLSALVEIKKMFWQNTQNWETLLYERAAISGKLVLSDFTKTILNQVKS